MIDYMLVVVLIGILVIIYRQMIKVDDVLDTIEHNYIELYSDNIDIFQKKEDIERVIKKLYDQKKNKC